ncbi:hypothetical protein DIPPA_19241 [Diplonema papillatum]|nr:hypothetical protein DIPPA_19241 [Diplonema papillatum]
MTVDAGTTPSAPPPQTGDRAAAPQQGGAPAPNTAPPQAQAYPPAAPAKGAPSASPAPPASGVPAPSYEIRAGDQPVLSFTGSAPYPPPPISSMTPDEMWQQRVNNRNMSRAMEEERYRQRQATSKQGFLSSVESAMRTFGHQANAVCSDITDSAERSLRDADKNAVHARYQRAFPDLARQNRLLAGFECTLYNGYGEAATGTVFLTERLFAFAPDAMSARRPPVFDELKNVVSYQVVQTLGAPAVIIFTGAGFAFHFALFQKNVRQDLQFLWGSASGPPFSNFLTYFDHQWRFVTPVPAPGYRYGPSPFGPAPPQ